MAISHGPADCLKVGTASSALNSSAMDTPLVSWRTCLRTMEPPLVDLKEFFGLISFEEEAADGGYLVALGDNLVENLPSISRFDSMRLDDATCSRVDGHGRSDGGTVEE